MTDFEDPRLDREVYAPAEDSTLLATAAETVIEPNSTVVETGTGSGVVADRLRSSRDVRVLATDINPHACEAAADRGLDVARMSLLDAIADGSVDAAVFNPPYLPDDDRLPDDWLDRATSGGPTGIELVSEWITDLPRVLTAGGVGVCIVSSLTDIDAVVATAEEVGLAVEETEERSFGFERLVALSLRPG